MFFDELLTVASDSTFKSCLLVDNVYEYSCKPLIFTKLMSNVERKCVTVHVYSSFSND